MQVIAVPSIFWTTLLSVTVILTLSTLIGRACGSMFPYRFVGLARFYMAPVLGLAILTVIASLTGRFVPMGNSVLVPVLVLGLTILAIVREQSPRRAFFHGLLVSFFGMACGASVLGALFAYGGFNAHNDAFTYLVHSNWLQANLFSDVLTPEEVTPLTTQIFLYQQGGFRMGASFLLALAQSLLNLRWSYEVYPSVNISAVTACCLAIGFPLAKQLSVASRGVRLALLALPAFTLGGLIFGSTAGFLPQTVGLSMGAGLLFAIGPLLGWLSVQRVSNREITKVAVPIAMLFSAAVYAYSELAPFLLMAVLVTVFILGLCFRAWWRICVFIVLILGIVVLLLNTELIRAYAALRIQSGAVVGSPVDWSLLGYFAHALGMHGGAWDLFQWTLPADQSGLVPFVLGLVLLSFVCAIILSGRKVIGRTTRNGTLMPSAIILMVFCAGLLYFRYVVPSPFPKGLGQSWSQFKLVDWAHPFAMAFVLLAVTQLRQHREKFFDYVVSLMFVAGLVCATVIGVARVKPLIQYYGGIRDLNRFYQDFRQTVLSNCSYDNRVYLALNEQHHKFRQMAVYYLPDREVISDWADDVYIFGKLPAGRRMQAPNLGDCAVGPISHGDWASKDETIGIFQVGVVKERGAVRIVSASGAYEMETDGNNWWQWVEHKVIFQLQPQFVPNEAAYSKLYFEYGARGEQILTVRIHADDGSSRQIMLHNQLGASSVVEKIIDIPASKLSVISMETDGQASRLGEHDPRVAAFSVRNIRLSPVNP